MVTKLLLLIIEITVQHFSNLFKAVSLIGIMILEQDILNIVMCYLEYFFLVSIFIDQ